MNEVDWIGFAGVFQILLAYVLNVIGKVEKNDLTFILLNLIGAGMACYASVLMNYIPLYTFKKVFGQVYRLSHSLNIFIEIEYH